MAADVASTDDDRNNNDDDALMHIDDVCGEAGGDFDSGAGERGDATSHVRRLETHLWHAKRFDMRQRWGYTLPEAKPGRGRGWRAALAGTRDAAVVHDASYHAALLLWGAQRDVLRVLSEVVDDDAGGGQGAGGGGILDHLSSASALRGDVAVDITLRHRHHSGAGGDYGGRVIAPAMVIWRPAGRASSPEDDSTSDGADDIREMLMWVHPSAESEARSALTVATAAVAAHRRMGKGKVEGGSGIHGSSGGGWSPSLDSKGNLCTTPAIGGGDGGSGGGGVEVCSVAGLCRLEVLGRTAAAWLSALVASASARAWLTAPAASGPRGVLRGAATKGDPREAAWAARRVRNQLGELECLENGGEVDGSHDNRRVDGFGDVVDAGGGAPVSAPAIALDRDPSPTCSDVWDALRTGASFSASSAKAAASVGAQESDICLPLRRRPLIPPPASAFELGALRAR
jgi:ribonuclease P/MRP protein subunit POP1